MGVTPIPMLRGVQPAKASSVEREVVPTGAVDPAGRMGDDFYGGRGNQTERGLEEEDENGTPEVQDEAPMVGPALESVKKVDFFA